MDGPTDASLKKLFSRGQLVALLEPKVLEGIAAAPALKRLSCSVPRFEPVNKKVGKEVIRSQAVRIADEEVIRNGYDLKNLLSEIVEEKEVFKVNYFLKAATKGGGITVVIDRKTGEIKKVSRWK